MIEVPIKVDDLILCGGCGRPNVITVLGTRLLDDLEFQQLHPEEKKELNFAQRAIKRQLRNN